MSENAVQQEEKLESLDLSTNVADLVESPSTPMQTSAFGISFSAPEENSISEDIHAIVGEENGTDVQGVTEEHHTSAFGISVSLDMDDSEVIGDINIGDEQDRSDIMTFSANLDKNNGHDVMEDSFTHAIKSKSGSILSDGILAEGDSNIKEDILMIADENNESTGKNISAIDTSEVDGDDDDDLLAGLDLRSPAPVTDVPSEEKAVDKSNDDDMFKDLGIGVVVGGSGSTENVHAAEPIVIQTKDKVHQTTDITAIKPKIRATPTKKPRKKRTGNLIRPGYARNEDLGILDLVVEQTPTSVESHPVVNDVIMQVEKIEPERVSTAIANIPNPVTEEVKSESEENFVNTSKPVAEEGKTKPRPPRADQSQNQKKKKPKGFFSRLFSNPDEVQNGSHVQNKPPVPVVQPEKVVAKTEEVLKSRPLPTPTRKSTYSTDEGLAKKKDEELVMRREEEKKRREKEERKKKEEEKKKERIQEAQRKDEEENRRIEEEKQRKAQERKRKEKEAKKVKEEEEKKRKEVEEVKRKEEEEEDLKWLRVQKDLTIGRKDLENSLAQLEQAQRNIDSERLELLETVNTLKSERDGAEQAQSVAAGNEDFAAAAKLEEERDMICEKLNVTEDKILILGRERASISDKVRDIFAFQMDLYRKTLPQLTALVDETVKKSRSITKEKEEQFSELFVGIGREERRLKNALERWESDMAQLSESREKVQAKIDVLTHTEEAEEAVFTSENEVLAIEIKELEEKLKQKKKKFAENTNKMHEIESRIQEKMIPFSSDLAMLKGHLEELEEQRLSLSEEENALKETKSNISARKEQYLKDYNDREVIISDARKLKSLVEISLDKTCTLHAKLEDQLAIQSKQEKALREKEKEYEEKRKELLRAVEEVDGQSAKVLDCDLALGRIKRELEGVSGALIEYQERKKASVKTRDFKAAARINTEVKALTTQAEGFKSSIIDLEAEKAAAETAVKEKNKQLGILKKEVSKCDGEADRIRVRQLRYRISELELRLSQFPEKESLSVEISNTIREKEALLDKWAWKEEDVTVEAWESASFSQWVLPDLEGEKMEVEEEKEEEKEEEEKEVGREEEETEEEVVEKEEEKEEEEVEENSEEAVEVEEEKEAVDENAELKTALSDLISTLIEGEIEHGLLAECLDKTAATEDRETFLNALRECKTAWHSSTLELEAKLEKEIEEENYEACDEIQNSLTDLEKVTVKAMEIVKKFGVLS